MVMIHKEISLDLNTKRSWAFLNSLFFYSIAILIFWLLFTKVDIVKTVNAIKGVKQGSFIQAVLISVLINVFISSDLKRRLLNILGCQVNFRESLFLKMGSLPFKLIPTLKETGLVQAMYLKKYHGMPFSIGIFSTILANILSIISVLLFFLLGVMLYWQKIPEINDGRYIYIFAVIAIVFLSLFFILLLNRNIIRELILVFLSKKNTVKIFKEIILIWNRISCKNIIWLILYNMVFQSSELIIFYILSKGFYLNINFILITLYIPLTILASNLPITISGLGIRESAILVFFLKYGAKEDLLGLGILVSFVEHILPIMIGVFFLLPFVHSLKIKNSKII